MIVMPVLDISTLQNRNEISTNEISTKEETAPSILGTTRSPENSNKISTTDVTVPSTFGTTIRSLLSLIPELAGNRREVTNASFGINTTAAVVGSVSGAVIVALVVVIVVMARRQM